MSSLLHPNIVLLLGACVAPTGLYLITEYFRIVSSPFVLGFLTLVRWMSGGSVYDFLHSTDPKKGPHPIPTIPRHLFAVKPSIEIKMKILLDAGSHFYLLHFHFFYLHLLFSLFYRFILMF